MPNAEFVDLKRTRREENSAGRSEGKLTLEPLRKHVTYSLNKN